MTKYQIGVAAEREIRKDLESFGFAVIRSAGSKGPIDLLACDGITMMAIQVKRGAPPAKDSTVQRMAVESGFLDACRSFRASGWYVFVPRGGNRKWVSIAGTPGQP